MDGGADEMTRRENQIKHTDLLMGMKDLEEAKMDSEGRSTEDLHMELNGSVNKPTQDTGSGGMDSPLITREEETIQDNLLLSCSTAEGSAGQRCPSPMLEYWVCLDSQHNMADDQVNGAVGPALPPVSESTCRSLPVFSPVPAITSPEVCSFISHTCTPSGSAWDALRSNPASSDQYPARAAAHLHLLGESLSLIGHHLQETNKTVCMSSSFSLLLDSLLCALPPLMCLTTQIPELESCTEHTLASSLENIGYVMPGL